MQCDHPEWLHCTFFVFFLEVTKKKRIFATKSIHTLKKSIMNRQQIIQTIHDYMAGQPVVKAWLFGSFARGEEKAKSDIDILFVPDYEKGSFTLLTHGGMYEDLKELLGREVDLVADGSLRPYAKASADHDKILVYERVS